MAPSANLVFSLFGLFATACGTPASRGETVTAPTAVVNVAAADAAASTAATVLGVGQPLQAGVVTFTGMVVPAKGGYRIGDAVVDSAILTGALPQPVYTAGLENTEPEWFVGADLRVTGLLEQVSNPPSPSDEPSQRTASPGFALRRVDAVVVAAPAMMIEGTLSPSKGFFQLASYLINRDDLAWALPPTGGAPGDQLRLWGQPHIVRCEPNAQCLLGGKLPIFVIGRAQRLAH